jgi:hypothetical protein
LQYKLQLDSYSPFEKHTSTRSWGDTQFEKDVIENFFYDKRNFSCKETERKSFLGDYFK